jgi:hypothetical protein
LRLPGYLPALLITSRFARQSLVSCFSSIT